MIAQWAWELVEPYVKRNLAVRGVERPSKKEILTEFARVWPDFSVTIMVQEPWMGTIRFKRLARLAPSEMDRFLEDPMRFIGDQFGGGKFKVNFHYGMHFVSTKNFKPEGSQIWRDLPELPED